MNSNNNTSLGNSIWSTSYLIDNIFNDLMDTSKEDKNGKKLNKYIHQALTKFQDFRIKSPKAIFLIRIKDLNKETTIIHLETYVKDCKTPDEKRIRLDGIFTEVIARIVKQAQPLILSNIKYEDIEYTKITLNEIREIISLKWDLVD